VYFTLDAAGQVRSRTELARSVASASTLLPPVRAAAGELLTPSMDAAIEDSGIVFLTHPDNEPARVVRYSPEGTLRWSATLANQLSESPVRVAVAGSAVAILSLSHSGGALTFLDRDSGQELAREDLARVESAPTAACLTVHDGRFFVATVRPVAVAPRPGLHAVIEAFWTDREHRTAATPMFIAETGQELDCAARRDGIGLVSLSAAGVVYAALDVHGALSTPARTIFRHPRRAGFISAHPRLFVSGERSFVSWEYRAWSFENIGESEAWLSVLDADGRPTRARSLGHGTRNVAFVGTSQGPTVVYENGARTSSVARVGCGDPSR